MGEEPGTGRAAHMLARSAGLRSHAGVRCSPCCV